jgi:putative toxin-antitoxin system antitoxin component (TIGR02293 family)
MRLKMGLLIKEMGKIICKMDILPLPLGKLSVMSTVILGQKKDYTLNEKVAADMRNGASTGSIAWLILGGNEFMPEKPASDFDFINRNIKKLSVASLASVLNVPMKDMATLLNISYKTLGRKKRSDSLDNLSSSLSIEIANTIAKGITVFDEPEKLNRWLQKENKALNGQKPFDLLNTPTGIKMVNRILGRIEEGVYS